MVKVLFVCVHNSARSQIAEAFLKRLGEGLFHVESAGLEKGTLNPYVVTVMKEIGYDISKNETNSVFDYYKEGRSYTYVIKVCDEINGQRCPIFAHALQDIYWNLADPSKFTGTEEEILEQTRTIRDEIKAKVLAFIDSEREYAILRKLDNKKS